MLADMVSKVIFTSRPSAVFMTAWYSQMYWSLSVELVCSDCTMTAVPGVPKAFRNKALKKWPVKMLTMPKTKPDTTSNTYRTGRRGTISRPSKAMPIMIRRNDQSAWCTRKYSTEDTICIGENLLSLATSDADGLTSRSETATARVSPASWRRHRRAAVVLLLQLPAECGCGIVHRETALDAQLIQGDVAWRGEGSDAREEAQLLPVP